MFAPSHSPSSLPESGEAPHLALEVTGGLPVALQAAGAPVHLVQLHEGIHELLGRPASLLGRVERPRDCAGEHAPVYLLHHVERDAQHRLVVADGDHGGHPHRSALERLQQARLAEHVVGRGRQRRTRRAAQHHSCIPTAHQERDVRVAFADALRLQAALPDAMGIEERLERLPHHERRKLEVGGVLDCVDHVHRGRDPT